MPPRLRLAVLSCLSGIALVVSGAVATMAFADDPSGCAAGKVTIELDHAHRLQGKGSGKCDEYSLRFFDGEIKWSKRLAPDPLTARITSSGYLEYKVDVRSCDHGNKRGYYARTYWTSTRGYHDSAHRELRAC
jgi:hypothetical protein